MDVSGGDDIVIDPADFRSEGFRNDLQLRDNVDQGTDAAFEGQKFIQHHYFPLFKDAVAALKITSFIADDVSHFIQYPFDLIQGGLIVLHTRNVLFKVTT
jgi:hypothetical protein